MNVLTSKIMDKLKKEVIINRNITIFLFVLMFIALISGSIFSLIIKSSDKVIVTEYLNNFINNLSLNKLNYFNIFINSISGNLLISVVIWLIGFSIIGIPIIIFMFFCKIFAIGFTFASLIINFKIKGILYSIIYLFPYGLLIILSYALIISYALNVSKKIFTCVIKKKTINFKLILSRYLKILFLALIMLLIASILESFFIPFIFKIINIIWK